ncbi:MAG TPA: hypothetical protein VF988_06470 [Verrucomicrobiae bacterium]
MVATLTESEIINTRPSRIADFFEDSFLNRKKGDFRSQRRPFLQRHVYGQQLDVSWRSYVHERFRDDQGTNAKRQRDLVLDLSTATDTVPVGKVADLTPRLARYYASTSAKTLQRDLAAVEKEGLIERTPTGVRAKRELILAFLPWRASEAKAEAAAVPPAQLP